MGTEAEKKKFLTNTLKFILPRLTVAVTGVQMAWFISKSSIFEYSEEVV